MQDVVMHSAFDAMPDTVALLVNSYVRISVRQLPEPRASPSKDFRCHGAGAGCWLHAQAAGGLNNKGATEMHITL